MSCVLSAAASNAVFSLACSCKFQACSSSSLSLYAPRSFAFRPVFPTTRGQNGNIVVNSQRLEPIQATSPSSSALVSSVSDLFSFICCGPLMEKLGYTAEKVGESIDKWILYGGYLCRLFQMNELTMSLPEKARIYHYYIPVYLWCEEQIELHRSKFGEGDEIVPLVIGVSAPQGSGKTTLVFALEFLFRCTNRLTVAS